ncbi:hypothetical protein OG613_48360 (plasmid) [Streptomyces sp. NBC_00015]|uniref:hypothetical protein n=1 Tax=Streptomyces sp. NBC_00015 TaxID=2903611 RepID=UPI002F912D77
MKKKSDDCLRLVNANVEHYGGPEPEPGVLPEKFLRVNHEVFVPLEPDLLALTELTYAQTRPGASAEEVAAADRRFNTQQSLLGMEGFRAEMGVGNNPTGCLVRRGPFLFGHDAQRPVLGHNTPPTVLTLRVPGAPAPIHVGVGHYSFNSPPDRHREVFGFTRLVDKVKVDRRPSAEEQTPAAAPEGASDPGWSACWLLSDTNELPEEEGELVPHPDWLSLTDDTHLAHRAELLPDGTWRGYTNVDQVMHNCRMYDAARWAAHHGQLQALAPTAGRARPDQGGPCRIDHVRMDAYTVQAVEEVHVIPMDGLSDHDIVVVDVSKRKLVETLLRRSVEPLPGWRKQPLLPRVITPSRAEVMHALAGNVPVAVGA